MAMRKNVVIHLLMDGDFFFAGKICHQFGTKNTEPMCHTCFLVWYHPKGAPVFGDWMLWSIFDDVQQALADEINDMRAQMRVNGE